MGSLYVIEYSVRQHSFHITTLEDAIRINYMTSVQKIDTDYRIISVYKTYEEATKEIRKFRKELL